MSGNSGPVASAKGDSTSGKSSKSGFDRLDINELFKAKSNEPVTKTVTQKHGMQTLGKAPPARRPGAAPPTVKNLSSSSELSSSTSQPKTVTLSARPERPQTNPGWTGPMPPTNTPGPPSPHTVVNAPPTGPPVHEKGWDGGSRERSGNYPSNRFAQEFPSLEAGGDAQKGSQPAANSSSPSTGTSKSQPPDNQYGPGPILRPQTEGSWTQGGSRNSSNRPPGSAPNSGREFGPDRSMGGPVPPLGPGNQAPPPLGAHQMPYRGMMHPPYMFPNAGGQPGSGGSGMYPRGPMQRFGMPIPANAPPPPGSSDSTTKDSSRGHRGGYGPSQHQPSKPTTHFSGPIIRKEDLKRMDEIGNQDKGWASQTDDVDYNKKISFSDDEDDKPTSHREKDEESYNKEDRSERRPVKILERKTSTNERDHRDREGPRIMANDMDDDRMRRKPHGGSYDYKERDMDRGRRIPPEDDWRSGGGRYPDDHRRKPVSGRQDTRGPPDFPAGPHKNIAPRFLRQQQSAYSQQPHPNYSQSQSQNQRTPSPIHGKERDNREWSEKDRPQGRDRENHPPIRILERRRVDSDSSWDSGRGDNRDRRYGTLNDSERERFNGRDRYSRVNSSEHSKEKEKRKDTTENERNDYLTKDRDSKEKSPEDFKFSPQPEIRSWADEIDSEDDYMQEVRKTEDREKSPREPVNRRVCVFQKKVENMTSEKAEAAASESNQPSNEKVSEEKQADGEQGKSSAWGDREKTQNESKEHSEKEEFQREGSAESKRSSDKEEPRNRHADKKDFSDNNNKKRQDDRHGGYSDSKEKIERKDSSRSNDRYGHKQNDHREDRNDPRGGQNRWKNRPNNRWDNLEPKQQQRERKTPDRDSGSGRSSEFGSHGPSNGPAGRNQHDRDSEKHNKHKDHDQHFHDKVDRHKSGSKESDLSSDKDSKDHRHNLKDDPIRMSNREVDRLKDSKEWKKERRDSVDEESDVSSKDGSKSNRSGRREKGGYGVYQANSNYRGWGSGSDSFRGARGRASARGGRGTGRDFYDKPNKRADGSEREDKEFSKNDVKDEGHEKRDTEESHSSEAHGKKDHSEDGKGRHEKDDKKPSRSPASNRRNAKGGTRLQGYGPPSDKTPFSNTTKDEHGGNKERHSEQASKPSHHHGSGPVPLMELGDISPPDMHMRNRHHAYQSRGRGSMPPRMQRDDSYNYRGSNRRGGRGDAKPLMSLPPTDLDRNEWHSDSASDEESFKKGGSQKNKKDRGHEKNKGGKASGTSTSDSKRSDHDTKNVRKPGGGSNWSENEAAESENFDAGEGEGGFQEVRNKKPVGTKDNKSAVGTNKPNTNKVDKRDNVGKERKIKSQPYEARPNQSKDLIPRFSKGQAPGQTTGTNKLPEVSAALKEPVLAPPANAWEKPISQALKVESSILNGNQNPTTMKAEISELSNKSQPLSEPSTITAPLVNTPPTLLDGTSAPIKTLVFENTNFKANSSKSGDPKMTETKKDSTSVVSQELHKEMTMSFGKAVVEPSNLTFASASMESPNSNVVAGPQSQSISSQQTSSKPVSITQSSRPSYVSNQPPISPLAADLNEKIQSVKGVWDRPSMPSVAEHSISVTEESSFSGGFGSDSFKSHHDVTNRDFGRSIQSGSLSGNPNTVAPIAKPDSSSSPNANNMRQNQLKSQQESQNQPGMTSSPFTYAAHPSGGGFPGISTVSSPPNVMSGSFPTAYIPTTTYQPFPHVGSSQVIGGNNRSQFGGFHSTQQGSGGGQYGMGSMFMGPVDPSSYSTMSSYQQSPGQSQGPNPVSRSSSGPISTSVDVSNSQGMMMSSSTNSMSIIGMKSQGGSGLPPHVVAGSQQGYHHHHAQLPHQSHQMPPVGHKGGFNQAAIAPPSQPMFLYDPNPVLNQNYMPSNMRSGPPDGPPPSATPPMQALQASYGNFGGSVGNHNQSVYPTGSSQGGSLQPLHVAVAPNPQALQNMPSANPHLGFQYASPALGVQGYNSQSAATVSALNIGSQLVRSSYMKQPGPEVGQQSQMKQNHDALMSQGWNAGFQSYHGSSKPGGGMNPDRNNGSLMNQRKGNSSVNPGGPGGNMKGPNYPGQKPRYPTPIQRPPSSSPSAALGVPPVGSNSSLPLTTSVNASTIGVNAGSVSGMKTNESDP